MARAFSIITIAVFSIAMTLPTLPGSENVGINIAILDTPNADKVRLVVEIKNLSNETKRILKNGRVDYINGSSKPLGNYIVDLEKLVNGEFVVFPPTADIDPIYEKEEYREIKANGFLLETIHLNGRSWKRTGFPQGKYRVRIAFNWDEWSGSLANVSKWTTFTIEGHR